MQTKELFVFLMAVALVLPLATAYNCTALHGEEKKSCIYLENTDWSQSEKDAVIQNLIDSGDVSLNGNFESIMDKPVGDEIQLNKLEEMGLSINEKDKGILINLSSISLFGYIINAFVRKYYLLSKLL